MRVRSLLPRNGMRVSSKALLGALALGGGVMASASAFAPSRRRYDWRADWHDVAGVLDGRRHRGLDCDVCRGADHLLCSAPGTCGSRVSLRTGKPARWRRAWPVSC